MASLKQTVAIALDWDGTLLDSMPLKRKSFAQAFAEIGFSTDHVLKLHTQYSGIKRLALFSNVYRDLSGQTLPSELYRSLQKRYVELNDQGMSDTRLFSDALPFLDQAKARGIRLCVSSSTPEPELCRAVEEKNLTSRFELILGSDPEFHKGEPHFKKILDQLNLHRNVLLFVGDDLQDEELAGKSSIPFRRIVRDSIPTASRLSDLNQIFFENPL